MIILVILAVTKPTKLDYVSWLKDKAVETAKPGLEFGLVAGLVSLLGNTVIDMTTTSKDYYFATVYTTTYGNEKITVLGILNNFITIKHDVLTNAVKTYNF